MRSAGAPRLLLMVVVVHQVAVAAPHDPAAACAAKAVTECVINRPMRNQQVGAAVRALEDLSRGGQGLRAHSIWRARPLATNLTHCDCAEHHEHHQPLRPGAGTSGFDAGLPGFDAGTSVFDAGSSDFDGADDER